MEKHFTTKLPSGSELTVQAADFDSSKKVYQTLLKELRSIRVDPNAQVDVNLYKDTFCSMLSSDDVEAAIMDCMGTVLIDKKKFSKDYFLDVEKRQDYIEIMYHVGKVNVEPFMKSLYAQFEPLFSQMKIFLA